MDAEPHEHHLWYTRRKGEVHGPFPASLISRYILLGRLHDGDELSQDRHRWEPLSAHPELMPDILLDTATEENRERLQRARLREDERRPDPDDEYRGRNRRAPETADVVQHRALRSRLTAGGENATPRWPGFVLLALVFVTLAAFALWMALRPPPVAEAGRDCGLPPAPGVNWSYCHLEGVRLAGASLDGANLSNANLVGADLRGVRLARADVSYANLGSVDLRDADLRGAVFKGAALRNARLNGSRLEEADLSFAVLRGADIRGVTFDGANLSRAVWVDGRVCAVHSIGICN